METESSLQCFPLLSLEVPSSSHNISDEGKLGIYPQKEKNNYVLDALNNS